MSDKTASRTGMPVIEQVEPSAEETARAIRTLLDLQQFQEARRTAARAAEEHPDHPWLVQAHRVLNPDRMARRTAQGRGRTQELAWLRRNTETYRGRWVALLGDELIVSAETFQEVQCAVQERELEGPPLLHYIA